MREREREGQKERERERWSTSLPCNQILSHSLAREVNEAIAPYWEAEGMLTLKDDLLLYGSRIVVPALLQKETLLKLHKGHLGSEREYLCGGQESQNR